MDVFLSGEPVTVQFSGSFGYSPLLVVNVPQNYQMLQRIASGATFFYRHEFFNYYGLKNVVQDKSIDLTTYELPVIKDTMYHTIKGKDNYILIELK